MTDDNPTLFERLVPWWMNREAWRYLLARRHDRDVPWWRVIRCRWLGHPAGIVFYNPGGLEPDTTCRECGDNIG